MMDGSQVCNGVMMRRILAIPRIARHIPVSVLEFDVSRIEVLRNKYLDEVQEAGTHVFIGRCLFLASFRVSRAETSAVYLIFALSKVDQNGLARCVS